MTPLEKLIQLILSKQKPVVSLGKIKSIDSDKRSCVIEFENGERADLEDCRLNAIIDNYNDFLLITPKVGSYVLFAQIEKSNTDVFVLAYSEIDAINVNIGETKLDINSDGIVMNGGNNNGLIKIQELTNKINDLISKFNSHTHAGVITAVVGQATGTPGNTATPMNTQALLNKNDYEDTKIKH